jgi:uncharacterized membrane protein YqjE
MADQNHQLPGIADLAGRFARTGLGALKNRGELLAVEWQEEKARMTELFFWCMGLMFCGMMAIMLLTATIIFVFPEEYRLYVASAFIVLYVALVVIAAFVIRNLLQDEPFAESIDQLRKDHLCFESSK